MEGSLKNQDRYRRTYSLASQIVADVLPLLAILKRLGAIGTPVAECPRLENEHYAIFPVSMAVHVSTPTEHAHIGG